MVKIDHKQELKNLPSGEHLTKGDKSEPVTAGDVLGASLMSCTFKGKDAITAFKTASKIYELDFDGNLEDAELEICEKAFEENPVGYTNMVRGQVLIMIERAKKESEE